MLWYNAYTCTYGLKIQKMEDFLFVDRMAKRCTKSVIANSKEK